MSRKRPLRNDEIEKIAQDNAESLSELSEEDSETEDCVYVSVPCNTVTSDSSESEGEEYGVSHNPVSDNVWKDVSECDSGPNVCFSVKNVNKEAIVPSNFDNNTMPVEYFSLFFDDNLFSYIQNETEHYTTIKKQMNTPPTRRCRIANYSSWSVSDIKALFGVIINMGLHPLSDIKDYFARQWIDNMPFFSDVFSRDEFLLLFWNLHFNHTDNENHRRVREKDFLIKPIVDELRTKFMQHYSPDKNISVDESTISFKGQISFKVYNPMKPNKFGVKIFVLADSSNGYVYNFLPYTGKTEQTDVLKTTKVVKDLCESLIKDKQNPPIGHHIYTDRYYSSPELSNELLKINMFHTGTVMTSRKGMPAALKGSEVKKMKKGEAISYRNNNLLALGWKDKRVVTVLSTKHKGSVEDMSPVNSRYPNQPPTMKPDAVIDYSKHMGGVDRADHYVANYQFLRRTRKWYRKVFFWLMEVSIVNSYILYSLVQEKYGKKAMCHKQFRKSIVLSLIQERLSTKKSLEGKKKISFVSVSSEQRLSG